MGYYSPTKQTTKAKWQRNDDIHSKKQSALPCPAPPRPALPCPPLHPCPVLSCPVLPYPVLSCPTLPCTVLLFSAMLSCTILPSTAQPPANFALPSSSIVRFPQPPTFPSSFRHSIKPPALLHPILSQPGIPCPDPHFALTWLLPFSAPHSPVISFTLDCSVLFPDIPHPILL